MKIAVCIVGGLRTFAMPAVHESILKLITFFSWNADTFFMFTILTMRICHNIKTQNLAKKVHKIVRLPQLYLICSVRKK